MAYVLPGKITEVIVARMDKGEDLLLGIQKIAREANIETGVIMDITGSLTQARMMRFAGSGDWNTAPVVIEEMRGPLEVSGHGIIGKTSGSGAGGWMDEFKEGVPHIHVHMVATSATDTVCGHLMEGSYIRSHMEISHFTVIIGRIENVRLTLKVDPTKTIRNEKEQIISAGAYYELLPS